MPDNGVQGLSLFGACRMEKTPSEQRRQVFFWLMVLVILWGLGALARERMEKRNQGNQAFTLDTQRDAHGNAKLHMAVAYGKLDDVKIFLRQGASIEIRNKNDFTPLLVAAEVGNMEALELLIGQGANINAQNDVQFTALHIASKRGDVPMLAYLLEKGADAGLRGEDGFTARQRAAIENKPQAYEFMMQKGVP